jgi:uncharacterized RDD family membrane protein YckC
MTMSDSYPRPRTQGLPDPAIQPEFYDDVPTKRLLAWLVDVILIGLITSVFVVFSLLTAVLILPLAFMAISFVYRWATITSRSATPGMRLMAIELRQGDGRPFDSTAAFLHTAGYTISVVTFPLQLISVVMMLVGQRKQGLTDIIMGTAALNRRAG